MKKWIALLLTALILAVIAVAIWFGWKPLMDFIGEKGSLIQSADSLLSILAAAGSLASALFAFFSAKRDKQNSRSQPVHQETTVNTGGGTCIGGDINTNGGDFVGRNKNVNATINVKGDATFVLETSRSIWCDTNPKLDTKDLQRATAAYLKYLLDRHQYLTMKGIGPAENIPLQLKLLDLYIPLKARREVPRGETWERQLRLTGRTLDEDKDSTKQQFRLGEPEPVLGILKEKEGVIILGDPGAGKTTFLKFMALKLALGEGADLGLAGRLPILLPLASYANALQEKNIRLDDFITAYFSGIGVDLPIREMLSEALKTGKALLLLDGLDEARDLSLRNMVVERVTDFFAAHCRSGNKFVLTSRIVGYRAVRSAADGLVECTLVDFDDEEINNFISKWTMVIEKQPIGDTAVARYDAESECRDLQDAINTNQGVRRLATNPLLLTILVLMKRKGVTLPERRVQLYDQYLITLISTWNRVRSLSGRAPSRDLDELQTTRILAPLALWMHEAYPGVGLVRYPELRCKLQEIFAARNEPDAEKAAYQFLQDMREHTSILLERGPEEYGFIHLTFEEYLAAMALAYQAQGQAQSVLIALIPHISEQSWRELSLLAISYIGILQNLPQISGQVVEGLVKTQQGDLGEAVVLAGEAVLDAWPDGVTRESLDKVVEVLVSIMQHSKVDPDLRRRAGLLLGRLGWQPNDLNGFIEIAPGNFLYDAKKEKREILKPYWVAKYPVTNLQYARFIQADGYKNKEWWSQEGWDWKMAKGCLEPNYWHDSRFNNPIFPIVSPTWHEAQAYCNWLNRQPLEMEIPKGYILRLPTEEEWERAARFTDGRYYPWGESSFRPIRI